MQYYSLGNPKISEQPGYLIPSLLTATCTVRQYAQQDYRMNTKRFKSTSVFVTHFDATTRPCQRIWQNCMFLILSPVELEQLKSRHLSARKSTDPTASCQTPKTRPACHTGQLRRFPTRVVRAEDQYNPAKWPAPCRGPEEPRPAPPPATCALPSRASSSSPFGTA